MGTFNDGDSGSSIRTKINTAIQKTEGSSAISTIDVDGGAIDGVTLGTNSAVTEAQVDNININGNTISSTNTNGDVTIDPNGTGDVNVGNFKFDADQTVGSGQDNYVLTYDNSGGKISLEAASGGFPASGGTFTGDVIYADNIKAKFGAGDDLLIYHDSSTNKSHITESGSSHLVIQGQEIQFKNAAGTNLLAMNAAQVELMHSGNKKLETYSSGIQTTGTVNVNNAYTLPTSDGSANTFLKTDGSGTLSFAAGASGATDIDGLSDGYTDATSTSVGLGTNALSSDDGGNSNTALGTDALKLTTSGIQNSAVGNDALVSNTTGLRGSALGYQALKDNTTGNYNTALGAFTLADGTTQSNNSACGSFALKASTGGNNSALGFQAGDSITSGSNNTVLGYDADASSATVSNEITLGNSSVATLRCQVTSITSLSDERDKTDIQPLSGGLNLIEALRPVSFTWDMRDGGKVGVEDTGFIAQELQQAQEDTGITIPNLVYDNNPDKLEASYGALIPVLVKSMQDQQAQIRDLQSEIKKLKETNMTDAVSAEQIRLHYSAAMDSVNLINGSQPNEMSAEDWADCVERNRAHLRIMLAKDFWTTENLQPLQSAAGL